MSSSPLAICPQLPPTTNSLNSHQRTRLMRSTRKLGAVLGATPYLLESDTSFSKLPLGKTMSRASKRQGSVFTHHQISSLSIASSSTASTSSHRPCASASSVVFPQSTNVFPPTTGRARRSGDKTPQLYLRLDTVPVSPTDERVALPPSPCSPLTPTVPDAPEIHRKRMAKLTHHLGENVPVGLVVPSHPPPKPATMAPGRPRKRSQSVHVVHTQATSGDNDRPSTGQSRQDWVGEWNRSNISDVQKELRKLRLK